MAAYPARVKIKARDLFVAGMSRTNISKQDEMPSRVTLNEWIKRGVESDGVPWTELKDKAEVEALQNVKHEIASRRASHGREFLEEMQDFIENDLMNVMMAKAQGGEFDLSIGDFDRVARLYAILNNSANEKIEFATWFMRKVFALAVEIMDERQFALFSQAAIGLQHEVEAELNPLAPSEEKMKDRYLTAGNVDSDSTPGP